MMHPLARALPQTRCNVGRGWTAALPLATAWLLETAPGAGQAAASERSPTVHLGLRSGYGLPVGAYADATEVNGARQADINDIGDDSNGAIPIWLDLGYHLTPQLLLGAYGMYGIALMKTADPDDPLGGGCPVGGECSAAGWRFGLQGQYGLRLGEQLRAWVGLGFGYEALHARAKVEILGNPIERASSYRGFELMQLQGGADLVLHPKVALGPFVSFSQVRYDRCGLEMNGQELDCKVVDAALHGWLVLGLRGYYEP
jgi:hypothetical protein